MIDGTKNTMRLACAAYLLFAVVLIGMAVGIGALSLASSPKPITETGEQSHEQRSRVIVEIDRVERAREQSKYGDWDAVRSEALNDDTMPRETEAFKRAQYAKWIDDTLRDHEARLKKLEGK